MFFIKFSLHFSKTTQIYHTFSHTIILYIKTLHILRLGGFKMNNLDMNALMKIISKMDKKDLEAGLAKAQEILKQKNNGNN